MRHVGTALCLLAAVALLGLILAGMGEPAEKLVWNERPEVRPGCYWGRGGSVRYGAAGQPRLAAASLRFTPGTFAARNLGWVQP